MQNRDGSDGPDDSRRRKALVYHREAIDEAGDLIQLARKDGKMIFGCDKVKVLPETAEMNGDLVVEVEKIR